MKQKDLNIKYICEKTLLDKQDELVPIILKMIKESYKAGLNQAEYDNTMRIIEENDSLKKQQKEFVKYLEDRIKENSKERINDNNGYQMGVIDTYENIIEKYKEIIGDIENE